MVGFTRKVMSDKRGMMSAGHGNAGLVETMLKLHETANSLRLTAYGPDEGKIRDGEGWRGTLPIFPSDVKARHSGISDCRLWIADWPKDRHRIVSLVEMMMTADSLRLTAYGLGPCRTVRGPLRR